MTDVDDRIAGLSPEQRAELESRVAGLLAGRDRAADSIPVRDRSRPTPLSFAQQREWALERLQTANNISGVIRLEGEVDLDLLSRILSEICARHEVLRSTVEMVDGAPVQVVQPASVVPVPLVDLSVLEADEQRQEVQRLGDAEAQRPFPPDADRRLRFVVVRLTPTNHLGLLTVHHAAADGWSSAIVLQETAALYQAFRTSAPVDLPPLPIQYGDFAAWQREHLTGERLDGQLQFWREALADLPPQLELPTDRAYPHQRTYAGGVLASSPSESTAAALQEFAGREQVSVAMVMLAVTSVVLHSYTGQDDLVLGSAVTGRVRPETERLIGCFANVVPLRIRLRPGQTLRQVLHQARDTAAAALDHEEVPFDRLVEEFAPDERSRTPLVRMMVNVLTAPGGSLDTGRVLEMPGLRISLEPVGPAPLPIDLLVGVDATPRSVHLEWQYSTDLFDHATVAQLAEVFLRVLEQLIAAPDTPVTEAGRPEAEPMSAVPGGATPCPAAAPTLVELFQDQVRRTPDAPAVLHRGVATTFGALNAAANRLARSLQARGVGPESSVGVRLDRSPELLVAVLAVLKAGGRYVPIDQGYPGARVAAMLADAQAGLLLSTSDLHGGVADVVSVDPVLLDGPLDDPVDGAADLPAAPAPTSSAYVIYTSGSTGRPKGVVVEHRSLAVFAREVADRLQLGAGDRFLQFASPGFDVLAEELFPVWLAGGCVVVPAPRTPGTAIDLTELLERERVTAVELPAAYWHEWVRELDRTGQNLPPTLRLVVVGAERVLPDRLRMWQRHRLPLLNVYGLTETTVSSTFFRLPADAQAGDLDRLPIGTALPSARLQILDAGLRPGPAGTVGELYISGVSLARGYLGRAGLTAARFVADPDPARPGGRAYRTGDLVRRRHDGNLEFLSRADEQIKIRGFRIEPAEIEAAIVRHPQVAQAAVAVHAPAPGDRRLVAYLVPEPRTQLNLVDVRRLLVRELPPQFVPAAFVQLERLPLNTNGKVDRDRLPAPSDERPEVPEELVLPRTTTEQQLADIVAEVLGVAQIGVLDNFFELGGDSILAIQVASRAQERGLAVTPLDLFEHATVVELAAIADQPEPTAVDPGATESPAPDVEPASDPGAGRDGPPSAADFPLARVDQAALDALFDRVLDQQD